MICWWKVCWYAFHVSVHDGNARTIVREDQHQYSDQRQANRHVFALVYYTLRETGAVTTSWPLQVQCGEWRGSMRRLCCPEYSLVYAAWEVVVSFLSTRCIRTKARGQESSPPVLLMASSQDCRWTRLFMPCVVISWGSIHKELSRQSTQPTWMGNCALHYIRGWARWLPNYIICDDELSSWNQGIMVVILLSCWTGRQLWLRRKSRCTPVSEIEVNKLVLWT
jgi:hypothetical protein